MKIILLLLVLMTVTPRSLPTTVYVCKGSHGKKYHLKADCRGLRNCQHRVVKMTMEQAKKEGKTLCAREK
jgi:hypothetical protein